jgi:SNF2 family DNA or RNA helicase
VPGFCCEYLYYALQAYFLVRLCGQSMLRLLTAYTRSRSCIEEFLRQYNPSFCPFCRSTVDKNQLVGLDCEPSPSPSDGERVVEVAAGSPTSLCTKDDDTVVWDLTRDVSFSDDTEDCLHISYPSTKIKMLLSEIAQFRLRDSSCRFVIFSQFTTMLSILKFHLEAAGYGCSGIEGSMSRKQRTSNLENFNSKGSEIDCFLVSLKAGNVGINLQSAQVVFLVDTWYNPAAEDRKLV